MYARRNSFAYEQMPISYFTSPQTTEELRLRAKPEQETSNELNKIITNYIKYMGI